MRLYGVGLEPGEPELRRAWREVAEAVMPAATGAELTPREVGDDPAPVSQPKDRPDRLVLFNTIVYARRHDLDEPPLRSRSDRKALFPAP